MPVAVGKVVVVQEGRFRLIGDDGRASLFVLAHNAPLQAQDLLELQRHQRRVCVDYGEAPGLIARLAHDIRLDPARERPPRGDGSTGHQQRRTTWPRVEP